jgi:hypothetical protein
MPRRKWNRRPTGPSSSNPIGKGQVTRTYDLSSGGAIEEKMQRTLLFLMGLAAMIFCCPTVAVSQDYIDPYAFTSPKDTIDLGRYTAILYDHVDSIGRVNSVIGKLAIYDKDERELISHDGGWISNLCAYDTSKLENCNIRDINGDGLEDILVSIYTGGANCCFGANLYSLDDSIRLIFEIESNLRPFDLADLEKDHIPEFIVRDETFAHWKDTYRWYLPILIWRWDGDKYRLANFRFPDYVLQEYGAFTPCDDLWGSAISLSYAGRIAEADSIFLHCWPDSIPGKMGEFRAFKKELEGGKYWQELQQSDW